MRNQVGTKSKTPVQRSCRFWKKEIGERELEVEIWAQVGGNQRETQVQEMLDFTIEVPIGEKENLE